MTVNALVLIGRRGLRSALGTCALAGKAQGLDISIRARSPLMSDAAEGARGELLQIRDAFNDTLLHFIGENDSRDDRRARLARLSFRALRSMARFPSDLERVREVRRLTNQPNQQPE